MPLYTDLQLTGMRAEIEAAPTAEDIAFLKQRYVRVMCDSSAEGVWDISGGVVSIVSLPVSLALMRRILGWQDWYEAIEDAYFDTRFTERPDWRAFASEGLGCAIALKGELPDWQVIYHDAARSDWTSPRRDNRGLDAARRRGWFEYEVWGAADLRATPTVAP